jgi:hypothetical protein
MPCRNAALSHRGPWLVQGGDEEAWTMGRLSPWVPGWAAVHPDFPGVLPASRERDDGVWLCALREAGILHGCVNDVPWGSQVLHPQ